MTMKMTLIDKDKFIQDVISRKYSQASMRLIREQPEVKAIPYGFISKYSRRPISNADYWAIIRMVTAWEKENDN